MFKNLVKRSTITRYTLTSSTPVTVLIEGDEVNVWARPEDPFPRPGRVNISRQDDRELVAKLKYGGVENDEVMALKHSIWIGMVPAPLGGRSNSGILSDIVPGTDAEGTNLLCGFSDQVTFSIEPSFQDGVEAQAVANVFVEIINYEPRR